MNLKDTLEAAALLASNRAKENPAGGLKKSGTEILYSELESSLKQILGWCFKGDVEVAKITRCKNCTNYRRYRKKGARKSLGIYLCRLDKKQKSPEHFCAYGEQEE